MEIRWLQNKFSPNRIVPNVKDVGRKISGVADAVIAESALPNGKVHVLFQSESASGPPFDVLNGSFEGHVGRGCE